MKPTTTHVIINKKVDRENFGRNFFGR
jgi:hypothetical protein